MLDEGTGYNGGHAFKKASLSMPVECWHNLHILSGKEEFSNKLDSFSLPFTVLTANV